MKVERFVLSLNKEPTEPYIGGEEVQGKIELTVLEPVQISRLTVRIIGYSQTSWRNKNSDMAFESREPVLDDYLDLTTDMALHCNEGQELARGMHTIEFKMKLPLNILSTVSKENGNINGSISYTCMACLDLPEGGESEIISEKEMTIFSLLNLDAPHFRQPVLAKETVNIVGFICRNPKGHISAEVKVAELGLLPGEIVKIIVTLENTVRKHKTKKHLDPQHACTFLSLCQQIDLRSNNKYDPEIVDEKSMTIAMQSFGLCREPEGKSPETKVIMFEIPKDIPPTSTKANGLITCSYFFRLDMQHFDVIVPVVIGSLKTIESPT